MANPHFIPGATATLGEDQGFTTNLPRPPGSPKPVPSDKKNSGSKKTTVDARAFLSQRFSGNGLELAIAVMMAESGGDSHAKSTNSDGSIDRGLFQINSKWHSEVKDDVAYDASGNTAAAVRISKGGKDWHEWSTFNNGAYLHYYKTGKHYSIQLHRPSDQLPGGPSLPGVPNPLSGIEAIGAFFTMISSGEFWNNLGKVFIGTTLVTIAVIFLAHSMGISMPLPIPV